MPAPVAIRLADLRQVCRRQVPFINERVRNYLAGDYCRAGDYKAFALNIGGFTGSALNQPTEEPRATPRSTVPEARRCRAIAAALRALFGRQHRGLHRTASRRCRRSPGCGTMP
jgi:adenylate cyclase